MAEGKFRMCREGLLVGYSRCRKEKEISVTSRSDWKSDSLSLTWAPTVQAGPASEKLRGKGYAFYHNKAPEYSDPLSAIARLVRLVLKSVGE